MADIKVKDLTDTQTINTDNEIMVLTNKAQNQVQNITVGNLLSNVLSSDNDNVLEQGTDGKLYVETPENITGDLSDLSTTEKSSLVAAINEVDSDIAAEATTRANADNNLQSQIDAITAASDVTDIVGTYAELQAYDTTGLADKSVIKVLQDESRENETTYYRWVITGGVGAWVLIGEEGPYYTISQADSKFATQATVGNLSNLATSDKSSIVNAMNELASVLDPTQTADYIKNSKAIYSGEVSENALILPQIKEMAHSTFDRSKFIVVGSPNITDDGILLLDGTSNRQNYIFANIPNFDKTRPFKLYLPFKGMEHGDSDAMIYLLEDAIQLNYLSDGNINVFLRSGTSETYWDIALNYNVVPASVVSTKKDILLVIEFTGSRYIFGYIVDEVYTENTYTNTTTTMSNANKFNVGYNNINAPAFQGQIDLKEFSITVDGVEVFSGNKTGIDVIKPDDYTIVGTPTISADGVANTDSSNYIEIANGGALIAGKSWKIQNLVYIPNYTTNWDVLYFTDYNGWNFVFDWDSLYNHFYTSDGIMFSTNIEHFSNVMNGATGWFIFELIHDINTGEYTVNVKDLEENIIATNTETFVGYEIRGLANKPINLINNAYDLNAFKIYVDGNLVYQPCLKIPYTEAGNGKGYNASTGSKIVNAIYRDRVNDMADQFGYAPYYTLSDTDFTLPQGELYGYIEKRARDIAHPIAQPFYRFSDEINEDEVRLEGAEVDKGLYLAIEQDPYLSALCTAGSTADKICLPDFRGRVIYGDVASGYVSPELPNHSHTVALNTGREDGDYGSFDTAYNYASTVTLTTSVASASNSIYKDGGTVKTAGVKARWLCRWK